MARTKRVSLVRISKAPRAAKPVIIRQTILKRAKSHVTRKRADSRKLFSTERMEQGAAGFAVGMLEKMDFIKSIGKQIPLVGATGAIALGAYAMSDDGKNEMADNICTAASTIALYQLSSTGSIIGGDDPSTDGWGL